MTTPVADARGPCLPGSNSANEAELVARLRAGDEDAYETLFRTHAGAMLAVARRFFGDGDEAAEAVQDGFVAAFKGMGNFEGTSRLGTWLHRITVNSCLLKLRSRKRSRFVSLEGLIPLASQPEDDGLTQAETVAQVRAGIQQLPYAYQTVIQLRDLEGLDTGETARRLGTTEAAVKTRLHRARQALQSILAPRFGAAGTGG